MPRAFTAALTAALVLGATPAFLALPAFGRPPAGPQRQAGGCANEAGLSLPPGFCASIFAQGLGHARQIAVAADGTVYVNTWSSALFQTKPDPQAGYLVALRDTQGTGHADRIARFGPTPAQGSIGGTGIALHGGYLYAEVDDTIRRFARAPGALGLEGAGEAIVTGLPMAGDHAMKPIAIDTHGTLFVNVGSASNTCEMLNRQPGSKGHAPCTELLTRAGIWAFSADRPGQVFSAAQRYATGIRNTGGMTFDPSGRMLAVQHGRDQLHQNWPALYTLQQGVENPAEELIAPTKGADFGWPYCYYDTARKHLVLAPEYDGDGGRATGPCATKRAPVAAFPAHWAPTGVVWYGRGAAPGRFPAAWSDGVFIAFHGSWNRAPAPQDGFKVYFQPMRDGRAAAPATLFADGFAGPNRAYGRAAHRPTGIATGPDGALYVSDDAGGRVWRITYRGPANAPRVAARAVAVTGPAVAPAASSPRALPPGITAAQVALGERIYRGAEREGTCAGCHGADGHGTALAPALTGPAWLWADGSVASLARVIEQGVTKPRKFPGAMPARGGATLSDSDVQAVAAYVWSLSHP